MPDPPSQPFSDNMRVSKQHTAHKQHEAEACDRVQADQSDPKEVARGKDMSECSSLEKRRITNSKCQPDCQYCDWTNALWFSKAASACAHRLQHVKPYQKDHSIQQRTAQHNTTQQHKQQRSRATVSQCDTP